MEPAGQTASCVNKRSTVLGECRRTAVRVTETNRRSGAAGVRDTKNGGWLLCCPVKTQDLVIGIFCEMVVTNGAIRFFFNLFNRGGHAGGICFVRVEKLDKSNK